MKTDVQFFIRTIGKNEFKTYQLINLETFDILDNYFSSEKESKEYAVKNSLEIFEYV